MIAYRYPPCRAHPTAAARAHGLAHNLPSFGWQPTVLVPALPVGACGLPNCDHRQLDQSRGSSVVEVRRPVRVLRRARWRDDLAASASAGFGPSLARRLVSASLQGSRLANDWSAVARRTARGLHAEEPFDALWVTAGPFSQVPLGRQLRDDLGRPWVADLRDPVSRVLGGTAVSRRVEVVRRRRDASLLREADAVVHATAGFAGEDAAWGVPSTAVIRSGFDERAWAAVRASADPTATNDFEVVYAGRFYPERGPEPLVAAVAGLLARRPGHRKSVRLVYHGPTPEPLAAAARDADIEDVVQVRPAVAPRDVPAILRRATVNVLVTNALGIRDWPGGKFYDLVAAGRPILVLPDLDDWVTETVRDRGLGGAARSHAEATEVLANWFDRWLDTGSLEDVAGLDEVGDLSTQEAARQLGALLDRVA